MAFFFQLHSHLCHILFVHYISFNLTHRMNRVHCSILQVNLFEYEMHQILYSCPVLSNLLYCRSIVLCVVSVVLFNFTQRCFNPAINQSHVFRDLIRSLEFSGPQIWCPIYFIAGHTQTHYTFVHSLCNVSTSHASLVSTLQSLICRVFIYCSNYKFSTAHIYSCILI